MRLWIRGLLGWLVIGLVGALGGETLRVGSFNLRNDLMVNRMVRGVYRFEYPKPMAEVAANAEVLAGCGLDLLLVQEVGGSGELERLAWWLGELGSAPTGWGVQRLEGQVRGLGWMHWGAVALREATLLYGNLADETLPVRGVQALRIRIWGEEWWWANVHLKSRWSTDAEDPESVQLRGREVAVLVSWLDSVWRQSGGRVVVSGDFNAAFGDASLEGLRAAGWRAVPVRDAEGAEWTYRWRTAEPERIDGHWVRGARARARVTGVGVYDSAGSDHRLVVVELRR